MYLMDQDQATPVYTAVPTSDAPQTSWATMDNEMYTVAIPGGNQEQLADTESWVSSYGTDTNTESDEHEVYDYSDVAHLTDTRQQAEHLYYAYRNSKRQMEKVHEKACSTS